MRLFNLQMFAEAETGTNEKADVETAVQTGAKAENAEKKETATESKIEKAEEKKYTDKDVDDIINRKFAEWQKKQDGKIAEEKKLAAMNAQQKAEYERDQALKELNEYKRKDTIAEMSKTARKMLSDEGITIGDELLSMLVTTDAEETKTAVDGFAKMYKDSVDAAVKERLRGETPKKGAGGHASMTKEQIMAIKDPDLRQKKMLENKELFNF